jgi:hypothetical protein
MNPGYLTHLAGVTKASNYLKYGGYVGIAIGGGASYMKVQDVCAAGDADACERVKYTESGSFLGTVAGGAAAGFTVTGPVVTGLCVSLGVPTGGGAVLVCGIVGVGIASFSGGYVGGKAVEQLAEKIYQVAK